VPEPGAPELGILLGARARIKNQEPELSLKFKTGAGDMAFEKYLRLPSYILTVLPNRLTCAQYSTLKAIVMSYDARLQPWIYKVFVWFNNR